MKEYLKFNKEFKKYAPIFLIMLAIVLLMGTSYALLRSSQQGENTYVMNVGLLEVTFVDSETNELTINNAVPMTDSEGMSQSDELIFTVKNTGDFKAQYNVYIEETSTNPAFKTVIRFIANKNDTGYNSPKTLSEDNYIDQGGILAVGESATYKVKLWLSETADNTYMNKTFTARIVVEVFQVQEPILSNEILTSINDSSNQVSVVEDGITYISGSKDAIDFNYVWYSGKLWRITAIYPDGTMKMLTDDAITTISYGEDVNFYTDESNTSYMYQWLNEDFLSTLYNYENIIVTDASWNATQTSSVSTKPAETTMVTAPVGLLNSYEYYKSYQNIGTYDYDNGYLNIGYCWWLLNPYSSSNVWLVNNFGLAYNNNPSNVEYGARPSINLQSGITINGGTGTSDDPYTISRDKGTANTTFLNTRQSGEYVNFDGDLYRIVGIENNTTKLNKMDYVRDESDAVIEKNFSSSTTFGSGNSDTYWDYYLNNTWYNSINETYKNMLVEETYYLGTVADGVNYKASICATASNTVTTANCAKTTSIWTGYVGLPRYGEMFASQQGSGYSSSENMWLITPYDSSNVWPVYSNGHANSNYTSNAYGARPSINLSSAVKITGGTGHKNDPFEISM